MRLMRLVTTLATLAATAAVPLTAFGHSGLISSTPVDGSMLSRAPGDVRLVFGGELAPEGTGFTVVDEFGMVVGEGSLDLDIPDRNEVSGEVAIEASGSYTIRWSSTARDGHHEDGDLEFSFDPGTAAPPPDTALPPAATGMTSLGFLLLLAGAGLGARKVRSRA